VERRKSLAIVKNALSFTRLARHVAVKEKRMSAPIESTHALVKASAAHLRKMLSNKFLSILSIKCRN
jgi:F0F1-type ATP synthase delta subunit